MLVLAVMVQMLKYALMGAGPRPASPPLPLCAHCGMDPPRAGPRRRVGARARRLPAAPWRGAVQGRGPQAVSARRGAPRGLAPRPPPPPRSRLWGPWDAASGTPHTPACLQRLEARGRGGRGELGLAQGGAASCGAGLLARAPTPQAEGGGPRDLADAARGLASPAQPVAGRLAPGASGHVGARHGVRLEDQWLLSHGLHTTRQRLSTPLR